MLTIEVGLERLRRLIGRNRGQARSYKGAVFLRLGNQPMIIRTMLTRLLKPTNGEDNGIIFAIRRGSRDRL